MFVSHLLHTVDFGTYATGVSVPTLNRNYVHNAVLAVPPLPNSAALRPCSTPFGIRYAVQEDVIAAAKEFKRSLMHRLFTVGPGREPAPTKETLFGDVPAHWESVVLDHCAEVQTGLAKEH